MNEATLAELPRVLSRPPWVSGRASRELIVTRVTTKQSADAAKALALFNGTCVFGGWRSDPRGTAWQHFAANLEPTLLAILPIAVGEAGPRRKIAERVVRDLATRHADVVRTVAASHGKRAMASVEEILLVDRRFDCPNTPPDLPATFKPEGFTRPLLRDGRALPIAAIRRIGEMLAFSSLDRPYFGLIDVKEACEPRSLAELAWDMTLAWDAANGIDRDAWMIEALAHLADDLVIRRTATIASPSIVTVLAHVGTTTAAMELCVLAWRARQAKRNISTIDAAFATAARKRGLTVEELEDSLVPTVAVATPEDRLVDLRATRSEARVAVEYGSRSLLIGIDEGLDAFVQTVGGTRMRELPDASGEDQAKIAKVEGAWNELQEDVAAIVDVRIHSLERAMTSGRTWTIEAFRRAWLEHPLMRHVALGVVWRSGEATFRIAEDGSFADIDDAILKEVAEVSVANPKKMTKAEIARWAAILEDYRIVQPIEQIFRSP